MPVRREKENAVVHGNHLIKTYKKNYEKVFCVGNGIGGGFCDDLL